MFWLFVQYLWYLLAALALGVLVGWLWWGRRLKRSVEVTQDVQRQLTSAKAGHDQLAKEHEATERQLVSAGDASKQHGDAVARIGELETSLAAVTTRAQDGDAVLAAANARAEEHATRLASLRAEHVQLAHAHAELQGVSRFVLPPLAERVPAGDRRDDLTVVEGIGPKMADALHAAGIHTFEQLSNATEPELRVAVEASKLSFAPSIATWSKQAALLARGDQAGFATYTAWLVAGVPPTDGSPDPLGTRFRASDRILAMAGAAPARAAEPAFRLGSGPDDLTIVEGIGPKMAAALHAAGIHTFAQLSTSTEPQLRSAVEAAGLPFAPSIPTWAKQADHLAKGDVAGFTAYTDRLVAGREPGTE